MSTEQAEPAVRITLSDIYEQGRETAGRVGALESAFAELADQRETQTAFDTRLRTVEQKVAAIPEPPPRASGWQITGVVVAALVGTVTVLGGLLALVQAITR